VALVVIDYLGRIRSQDRNSKNAEIAEVTAALCEMKRNLCVPILLGCQLNRSPDKRGKESGDNFGDYRPILSDLRDSGSIEQDADIVMFLSRQEVYDGTRQGTADIRIAKNRNGEIGDFELRFTHEQAKFYDLGKESYE
jgi:replicative DNA helicase